MTASAPLVLFAGGGTGGHVFPLVALAEAFERVAPHVRFRFVGSARGLETRVIPARGWELDLLSTEPLAGRSFLASARGAMVAGAGVFQAAALIAKHRPSLVVSIGGYAAGPISLAAAAMFVPVALLEPNRTAGLTQRLLKPVSRRIYVGFEEALAEYGSKGRSLGVPLRRGFAPVPPRPHGPSDPLNVFVMGGSQGAQHLNETLPAAIAKLTSEPGHPRLRILHQAGRDKVQSTETAYAAAIPKHDYEIEVHVVDFLDDVQKRLASADVVIARAGALTCAEICAVGRPSILVPYPFAADDHQAANAEAMERAGAAIAMRQARATPDALASALRDLALDDAKRTTMAEAARRRGAPDAATAITRDLLELAGISSTEEAAHVSR
jgi:UDP-N-acetylglucosamine--N-acetylmuramyl-(pentapeptide) pyrophosphoryl-undecaprenol N-acetylglucosamine transferase